MLAFRDNDHDQPEMRFDGALVFAGIGQGIYLLTLQMKALLRKK